MTSGGDLELGRGHEDRDAENEGDVVDARAEQVADGDIPISADGDTSVVTSSGADVPITVRPMIASLTSSDRATSMEPSTSSSAPTMMIAIPANRASTWSIGRGLPRAGAGTVFDAFAEGTAPTPGGSCRRFQRC